MTGEGLKIMKHSEESKRIKSVALDGHERQACAFNYLLGALGAMTERGDPIECSQIANFVELAVANSKSWYPEEESK